jgi:uncharacterized Tic20 family protein
VPDPFVFALTSPRDTIGYDLFRGTGAVQQATTKEQAIMENHTQDTKSEEKVIGVICHVAGIIVVPLIVYMMKKDESPFLAAHAKQALLWQAVVTAVLTVAGFGVSLLAMLTFGLGGLLGLLLPPVCLVAFCFSVVAAVKCWKGENYEYPLMSGLASKF